MKIAAMADTHEKHERIDIPDVDVLIHAGDFCGTGRPEEASLFLQWWNEIDVEHRILIAGNHDRCFERRISERPGLLRKAGESGHYLQNESVSINGVTFYGSPYTPEFNDWSFMKKRGDELDKNWSKIPDETDVLITHGPPFGILDRARVRRQGGGLWGGRASRRSMRRFKPVGDRQLQKALKRVRPDLHIFGHIHEQYGQENYEGVTCVNASLVNEDYELSREPIILTVE